MSVHIHIGGEYITKGGERVGPLIQDAGGYLTEPGKLRSWSIIDGRRLNRVNLDNDDIVSVATTPEALPVRTVTRQEIVTGVYGRVVVEAKRPSGRVYLDLKSAFTDHFTAAELRAAARVFVSLAEALEQD